MSDIKNRVIEEIKKIYDPEIPVNIYELGLIYKIEVDEKNLPQVESILRGYDLDCYNIGTTTKEPKIIINGSIDISVEEAKHLWSNGLRDKIK